MKNPGNHKSGPKPRWIPSGVERVAPNALRLPHSAQSPRAAKTLPIRHRLGEGGSPSNGFTLVELLIGMSLALMVMSAVLSSYTFIGRSLFRLINQQTLITQGQRAFAYLSQDVRMARGISGTPSASSLVLILPTNTTATTTVTYTYDSSLGTLIRTPASGTALTLLSGLTSSSFSYYDASGNSYTSATLSANSYISSIKQVSLTYTAQTGTNTDGSRAPQTADYQTASPRLILRNQAFLQ